MAPLIVTKLPRTASANSAVFKIQTFYGGGEVDRHRSMSGMIPGVGLDEWRRISLHRRVDDPRYPCAKEREEFVARDTELDQVTSEARNRLEQRLGYSDGSCRSGNGKAGVGSKGVATLASRIRVSNWRSGLVNNVIFRGMRRLRSKYHEQVCAVCLDTCYGDREIIVLECQHKYHSKCLLPWLQARSNCPYCRNPV